MTLYWIPKLHNNLHKERYSIGLLFVQQQNGLSLLQPFYLKSQDDYNHTMTSLLTS